LLRRQVAIGVEHGREEMEIFRTIDRDVTLPGNEMRVIQQIESENAKRIVMQPLPLGR